MRSILGSLILREMSNIIFVGEMHESYKTFAMKYGGQSEKTKTYYCDSLWEAAKCHNMKLIGRRCSKFCICASFQWPRIYCLTEAVSQSGLENVNFYPSARF